jgi:hypothetical protein
MSQIVTSASCTKVVDELFISKLTQFIAIFLSADLSFKLYKEESQQQQKVGCLLLQA